MPTQTIYCFCGEKIKHTGASWPQLDRLEEKWRNQHQGPEHGPATKSQFATACRQAVRARQQADQLGISAEVLAFCQPGKQLVYTHGFQTPTPQTVAWSVRAIVDGSMVVYVADGRYHVERLALFQLLYESGALRPA